MNNNYTSRTYDEAIDEGTISIPSEPTREERIKGYQDRIANLSERIIANPKDKVAYNRLRRNIRKMNELLDS
jgi:ribosomal protein S15P/S13E